MLFRSPLKAEGLEATVTVRSDPNHGTLAVVQMSGIAEPSRAAVEKRCAELLGGFQIRHAVQFQ